MKKTPSQPSSSDPKKNSLFSGVSKSLAGIVAILIVLVSLILLLIFYPDFSGPDNAGNENPNAEQIRESNGTDEQIGDGKDEETGLIVSNGLELVKANCTNCHSSALIIQNRFTREGWHEKIVWMQETQGLWELGESESVILDYLAKNYAPEDPKGRRIPLSGIEWYELKN